MNTISEFLMWLKDNIELAIVIVGMLGALALAAIKVYRDIMNAIKANLVNLEAYSDAKDELKAAVTGYITTAATDPVKLVKSLDSKMGLNLNFEHPNNLNPLVTKAVQEKSPDLLKKVGISVDNALAVSNLVQSVYNLIKPSIKLLKKK